MRDRNREEIIQAVSMPLVDWYRENGRSLPWREGKDAYRIWVSEIMLQQTRIEAVKPYYARFMEELPTVGDLARVPEERLLKLWEGLGYYSRARNLKKCAMQVMREHGGVLPADYDALKALPGIGPYTAGAIASIAYGIRVPAVDGNVLRVLSRLCGSREDILQQSVKREWERLLLEEMPEDCPGEFNEAVMELGETICIPNGRPQCEACPVHACCQAYALGMQEELLVRAPKKARRKEKRTVLLLLYEENGGDPQGNGADFCDPTSCQGREEAPGRGDAASGTGGYRVGIRRRPEKGLLSGLYEFPSVEGHLTPEETAAACREWQLPVHFIRETTKARHIFTHVEWDMTGYLVMLDGYAMRQRAAGQADDSPNAPEPGIRYVDLEELRDTYALPTAFQAYREVLKRDPWSHSI